MKKGCDCTFFILLHRFFDTSAMAAVVYGATEFHALFSSFNDEQLVADTGIERAVHWAIWSKYGSPAGPLSKPYDSN